MAAAAARLVLVVETQGTGAELAPLAVVFVVTVALYGGADVLEIDSLVEIDDGGTDWWTAEVAAGCGDELAAKEGIELRQEVCANEGDGVVWENGGDLGIDKG